MSKPSKPNFPSPPSFQADPFLQSSQQSLSSTGTALLGGKFLDPNDPTVGFLNQLVALNPEATRTAVDLASRDVIRMRDQAQQNTLNQLEANNQLTSSVTGNRLSDLNEAFSSDISDIASTFYLADVERSLANVGSLFGAGAEMLNQVGGRGLQNQQQTNAFSQWKWGADVALENERFQRQLANEQSQAQMWGTFGGPVVGAVAGGLQGGPQAGMAGFNSGFTIPSMVLSAMSGSGGLGGGSTSGAPNLGSSEGMYTNDPNLRLRNMRTPGFGVNSSGGLV